MNTIKTIVVVATLLGVGYGAHKVLNQPIPNRFDSDGADWPQLSQAGAPSLDLPAMDAARPQITLPDLQPTPLGSVRSKLDTAPALAQASGTQPMHQGANIELPGSVGRLGASDDEPLQSTSIADFRRQGRSAISQLRDGAANLASTAAAQLQPQSSMPDRSMQPVPPAVTRVPTSLAEAQTQDSQIASQPYSNAYAAPSQTPSALALPAQPSRNALASVNLPPTGYVAAGVLTPNANGAFEQAWIQAEEDKNSGQVSEALRSLSSFYHDASLTDSQREQLISLLDEMAGSAIYSNTYHLQAAHEVRSGESLPMIAQAYGVSAEFLARVNGVAPTGPLAPGTRLKVVQGPFRAEVNLAEREITVFLGEYYAGRFSCAIGRDLPAQVSSLEVVRIAGATPYVDQRTGEQIAAGAANNPYGNQWIALQSPAMPGLNGLGIHAYGAAVEASDTRGCISVSESEAADLAAILSLGSRVDVLP